MKLADSHIHLFRHGFPIGPNGRAFVLADELAAYEGLRETHQIERALVVGYEGMSEFRGNNADLARWRHKRWIAPLAFCHIGRPPSPATIGRYADQGFVGISLYALTCDQANALADWPSSVVEQINARRWIISINARPASISRLLPFAKRASGCSILMSHLGLPGPLTGAGGARAARQRLKALMAITRLEHVGVKLSGFYAIDSGRSYYAQSQTYIRVLHEMVGSRRLFWGSDFSPALSHISFAQALDVVSGSGLAQSDLRAIMHDNLVHLITSVEGHAS
jgi:L-fuconolactonase